MMRHFSMQAYAITFKILVYFLTKLILISHKFWLRLGRYIHCMLCFVPFFIHCVVITVFIFCALLDCNHWNPLLVRFPDWYIKYRMPSYIWISDNCLNVPNTFLVKSLSQVLHEIALHEKEKKRLKLLFFWNADFIFIC